MDVNSLSSVILGAWSNEYQRRRAPLEGERDSEAKAMKSSQSTEEHQGHVAYDWGQSQVSMDRRTVWAHKARRAVTWYETIGRSTLQTRRTMTNIVQTRGEAKIQEVEATESKAMDQSKDAQRARSKVGPNNRVVYGSTDADAHGEVDKGCQDAQTEKERGQT